MITRFMQGAEPLTSGTGAEHHRHVAELRAQVETLTVSQAEGADTLAS